MFERSRELLDSAFASLEEYRMVVLKFMSDRGIGYSLLGVGIFIMLFCVASIFLVFTNKSKPITFFNEQDTSSKESQSLDINKLISQVQSGQQTSIPSSSLPQLNMFSPKMLNDSLNLTVHFFLMSFLLTFGYKIANLGVMLIRPVYVKMKTKEEPLIPAKN